MLGQTALRRSLEPVPCDCVRYSVSDLEKWAWRVFCKVRRDKGAVIVPFCGSTALDGKRKSDKRRTPHIPCQASDCVRRRCIGYDTNSHTKCGSGCTANAKRRPANENAPQNSAQTDEHKSPTHRSLVTSYYMSAHSQASESNDDIPCVVCRSCCWHCCREEALRRLANPTLDTSTKLTCAEYILYLRAGLIDPPQAPHSTKSVAITPHTQAFAVASIVSSDSVRMLDPTTMLEEHMGNLSGVTGDGRLSLKAYTGLPANINRQLLDAYTPECDSWWQYWYQQPKASRTDEGVCACWFVPLCLQRADCKSTANNKCSNGEVSISHMDFSDTQLRALTRAFRLHPHIVSVNLARNQSINLERCTFIARELCVAEAFHGKQLYTNAVNVIRACTNAHASVNVRGCEEKVGECDVSTQHERESESLISSLLDGLVENVNAAHQNALKFLHVQYFEQDSIDNDAEESASEPVASQSPEELLRDMTMSVNPGRWSKLKTIDLSFCGIRSKDLAGLTTTHPFLHRIRKKGKKKSKKKSQKESLQQAEPVGKLVASPSSGTNVTSPSGQGLGQGSPGKKGRPSAHATVTTSTKKSKKRSTKKGRARIRPRPSPKLSDVFTLTAPAQLPEGARGRQDEKETRRLAKLAAKQRKLEAPAGFSARFGVHVERKARRAGLWQAETQSRLSSGIGSDTVRAPKPVRKKSKEELRKAASFGRGRRNNKSDTHSVYYHLIQHAKQEADKAAGKQKARGARPVDLDPDVINWNTNGLDSGSESEGTGRRRRSSRRGKQNTARPKKNHKTSGADNANSPAPVVDAVERMMNQTVRRADITGNAGQTRRVGTCASQKIQGKSSAKNGSRLYAPPVTQAECLARQRYQESVKRTRGVVERWSHWGGDGLLEGNSMMYGGSETLGIEGANTERGAHRWELVTVMDKLDRVGIEEGSWGDMLGSLSKYSSDVIATAAKPKKVKKKKLSKSKKKSQKSPAVKTDPEDVWMETASMINETFGAGWGRQNATSQRQRHGFLHNDGIYNDIDNMPAVSHAVEWKNTSNEGSVTVTEVVTTCENTDNVVHTVPSDLRNNAAVTKKTVTVSKLEAALSAETAPRNHNLGVHFAAFYAIMGWRADWLGSDCLFCSRAPNEECPVCCANVNSKSIANIKSSNRAGNSTSNSNSNAPVAPSGTNVASHPFTSLCDALLLGCKSLRVLKLNGVCLTDTAVSVIVNKLLGRSSRQQANPGSFTRREDGTIMECVCAKCGFGIRPFIGGAMSGASPLCVSCLSMAPRLMVKASPVTASDSGSIMNQWLPSNHPLAVLELAHNRLTFLSARLLAGLLLVQAETRALRHRWETMRAVKLYHGNRKRAEDDSVPLPSVEHLDLPGGLRRLDISHNQLLDAGGTFLFHMLEHPFTCLESLIAAHCHFKADTGRAVARCMFNNRSLRHLNLSSNELGGRDLPSDKPGDSYSAFYSRVKTATRSHQWNTSKPKPTRYSRKPSADHVYSSSVWLHICTALRHNTTLLSFNVAMNPIFPDAASEWLVSALAGRNMHHKSAHTADLSGGVINLSAHLPDAHMSLMQNHVAHSRSSAVLVPSEFLSRFTSAHAQSRYANTLPIPLTKSTWLREGKVYVHTPMTLTHHVPSLPYVCAAYPAARDAIYAWKFDAEMNRAHAQQQRAPLATVRELEKELKEAGIEMKHSESPATVKTGKSSNREDKNIGNEGELIEISGWGSDVNAFASIADALGGNGNGAERALPSPENTDVQTSEPSKLDPNASSMLTTASKRTPFRSIDMLFPLKEWCVVGCTVPTYEEGGRLKGVHSTGLTIPLQGEQQYYNAPTSNNIYNDHNHNNNNNHDVIYKNDDTDNNIGVGHESDRPFGFSFAPPPPRIVTENATVGRGEVTGLNVDGNKGVLVRRHTRSVSMGSVPFSSTQRDSDTSLNPFTDRIILATSDVTTQKGGRSPRIAVPWLPSAVSPMSRSESRMLGLPQHVETIHNRGAAVLSRISASGGTPTVRRSRSVMSARSAVKLQRKQRRRERARKLTQKVEDVLVNQAATTKHRELESKMRRQSVKVTVTEVDAHSDDNGEETAQLTPRQARQLTLPRPIRGLVELLGIDSPVTDDVPFSPTWTPALTDTDPTLTVAKVLASPLDLDAATDSMSVDRICSSVDGIGLRYEGPPSPVQVIVRVDGEDSKKSSRAQQQNLVLPSKKFRAGSNLVSLLARSGSPLHLRKASSIVVESESEDGDVDVDVTAGQSKASVPSVLARMSRPEYGNPSFSGTLKLYRPLLQVHSTLDTHADATSTVVRGLNTQNSPPELGKAILQRVQSFFETYAWNGQTSQDSCANNNTTGGDRDCELKYNGVRNLAYAVASGLANPLEAIGPNSRPVTPHNVSGGQPRARSDSEAKGADLQRMVSRSLGRGLKIVNSLLANAHASDGEGGGFVDVNEGVGDSLAYRVGVRDASTHLVSPQLPNLPAKLQNAPPIRTPAWVTEAFECVESTHDGVEEVVELESDSECSEPEQGPAVSFGQWNSLVDHISRHVGLPWGREWDDHNHYRNVSVQPPAGVICNDLTLQLAAARKLRVSAAVLDFVGNANLEAQRAIEKRLKQVRYVSGRNRKRTSRSRKNGKRRTAGDGSGRKRRRSRKKSKKDKQAKTRDELHVRAICMMKSL